MAFNESLAFGRPYEPMAGYAGEAAASAWANSPAAAEFTAMIATRNAATAAEEAAAVAHLQTEEANAIRARAARLQEIAAGLGPVAV